MINTAKKVSWHGFDKYSILINFRHHCLLKGTKPKVALLGILCVAL